MGRLKDIDAEMHELSDFEKGIQFERERIIELLKDNSKCALDKGHDTKGYCFCEAVTIIKNSGGIE